MDDLINYMEFEWLAIEDGVVTIGLTEDAAADLSDELTLNLPEQDDIVAGGKICGDVESENGIINLYSPVAGTVIEVNEAVLENPNLIQEDPLDEGWLFKVEADDPEKLDRLGSKKVAVVVTDEEEDEEDEDEEDGDGDDDESAEPEAEPSDD